MLAQMMELGTVLYLTVILSRGESLAEAELCLFSNLRVNSQVSALAKVQCCSTQQSVMCCPHCSQMSTILSNIDEPESGLLCIAMLQ